MTEIELGEVGYEIKAVQHINGSSYGKYWGYRVERPNGEAKQISPSFETRELALQFASVEAANRQHGLPHDGCEDSHAHMWLDIGGEG